MTQGTEGPTAAFSADVLLGDAPLTVAFTDESTAGSSAITAWSWDFGDGGTSTQQDPEHTYTTAGGYTVSLTVTTADGTDTETKADYITVTQPTEGPTAAFSADVQLGNAPLTVAFSDESTAGSAAITEWAWDFGDGGTSTEQNPDHTFSEPGGYAVSLTVTTADGQDDAFAYDFILVRGITPASGMPGSSVSIVGDDFSADDAMDISIYFDDTEMPPAAASGQILTTSVPIMDAGPVTVRVEIDGTEVVDGLAFEVLEAPTLASPAGTVASNAQNDLGRIAAAVGTLLDTYGDTLPDKHRKAIEDGLDLVDLQLDTLGLVVNGATEEELRYTDQVLLTSGVAEDLADIRLETDKRMKMLLAMDALDAERYLKEGAFEKAWTIPARWRFVLDWLAGRLHHGMTYANVALMGLNAFAAGSPGVGAGVAILDVVAGFLNAVYTLVELMPMQIKEDSMDCTVGANNVLALNSYGNVVFTATFRPEQNLEQYVFGLFIPKFSEKLGLPSILNGVLTKVGSSLLPGGDNGLLVPPVPAETGVPVYCHEFCGDPPTSPNPPKFHDGGIASLAVAESRVYTEDTAGGPLYLWAIQQAYEFKGSFWDPFDRPRVEHYWVRGDCNVYVEAGASVEITGPSANEETGSDSVTVEGRVTRPDGSAAAGVTVTITISPAGSGESPGGGGVGGSNTVTTTTDANGQYSVPVPLFAGDNHIEVTVSVEGVSSTSEVFVRSRALPETYAVVLNRNDNSLSLIDPRVPDEFLRVELPEALDLPRDAVFLPDGETLMLLNSLGDAPSHLTAVRIESLAEIAAVASPLTLGEGAATTMDLDPYAETVLVPYRDYDTPVYELLVVDVRQPSTPRLADAVTVGPYVDFEDYGPRDVASGIADDGRVIALATVGFYQDGGPSDVVLFDVTNPYDTQYAGAVSVASRGGAIAAVPGEALAVVCGTSYFNGTTQVIDTAVDLIDFSDPDNPAVLGGLTLNGVFGVGFAVTPDGGTALVANAGSPVSPANTMIFLDISDPSDIQERSGVSPVAFSGAGSPRIAVSADGTYAVVTSHLSDLAVVFDLSDWDAPAVAGDVETGSYPYGVAFRN